MIYVTGDTHRTDLDRFVHFCREHPGLSKRDYMIVTGDFGGVFFRETLEEDLQRFSDLPFTVLFVDGNHENFDLLNGYPVELWKGGKVHRVRPDVIHLMRGQVFELEGKTFFTFGGATSVDRARRVEGETWWRQESPMKCSSKSLTPSASRNPSAYTWTQGAPPKSDFPTRP